MDICFIGLGHLGDGPIAICQQISPFFREKQHCQIKKKSNSNNQLSTII